MQIQLKDCGIAHKSKNKMTLPQSGAIVEEPLLAGKPVAVMGAAWVQVGVSLSHLVCFKYEVDQ